MSAGTPDTSLLSKLLRERGVRPERVHVIGTWADGDAIQPLAREASSRRQRLELGGPRGRESSLSDAR